MKIQETFIYTVFKCPNITIRMAKARQPLSEGK